MRLPDTVIARSKCRACGQPLELPSTYHPDGAGLGRITVDTSRIRAHRDTCTGRPIPGTGIGLTEHDLADVALTELAPELAELLDYRNRITWETNCGEHARLLDASYNETTRAEQAEARIQALTEATILWRDRPGGDIGLAIALSSILDTNKPEPPAATAVIRALRECDRIEAAVHANPQHPDFDGAYLACIRHIRTALNPPAEPEATP